MSFINREQGPRTSQAWKPVSGCKTVSKLIPYQLAGPPHSFIFSPSISTSDLSQAPNCTELSLSSELNLQPKMACSATSAALSSKPALFSPKSSPSISAHPFSLSISKSFSGLCKPLQPRVSRSISLSRGSHSRKSFVVKASAVSAF